jgi:hypothetical protein
VRSRPNSCRVAAKRSTMVAAATGGADGVAAMYPMPRATASATGAVRVTASGGCMQHLIAPVGRPGVRARAAFDVSSGDGALIAAAPGRGMPGMPGGADIGAAGMPVTMPCGHTGPRTAINAASTASIAASRVSQPAARGSPSTVPVTAPAYESPGNRCETHRGAGRRCGPTARPLRSGAPWRASWSHPAGCRLSDHALSSGCGGRQCWKCPALVRGSRNLIGLRGRAVNLEVGQ